MPLKPLRFPAVVHFTYTNYKGETTRRHARVYYVDWTSAPHHPVPQWIMVGQDLEKQALRSFAMADMKDVTYD